MNAKKEHMESCKLVADMFDRYLSINDLYCSRKASLMWLLNWNS